MIIVQISVKHKNRNKLTAVIIPAEAVRVDVQFFSSWASIQVSSGSENLSETTVNYSRDPVAINIRDVWGSIKAALAGCGFRPAADTRLGPLEKHGIADGARPYVLERTLDG